MTAARHPLQSGLFLRAAAVITALWAVGHTYGTFAVAYGPEREVLWAQTVQVEGSTELLAGMFLGYGALITVFMAMQAMFFWHLSGAQRDGRRIRGVTAGLAGLGLLNTVACATYLIAIPTGFSGVITLCAALAAALDTHPPGTHP